MAILCQLKWSVKPTILKKRCGQWNWALHVWKPIFDLSPGKGAHVHSVPVDRRRLAVSYTEELQEKRNNFFVCEPIFVLKPGKFAHVHGTSVGYLSLTQKIEIYLISSNAWKRQNSNVRTSAHYDCFSADTTIVLYFFAFLSMMTGVHPLQSSKHRQWQHGHCIKRINYLYLILVFAFFLPRGSFHALVILFWTLFWLSYDTWSTPPSASTIT
jgi:hypothetical protein